MFVCFRVAAESDDGRMFEQQQDIADAVFLAQFDEALLQAQAGGVIERAELEDGDHKIRWPRIFAD